MMALTLGLRGLGFESRFSLRVVDSALSPLEEPTQ